MDGAPAENGGWSEVEKAKMDKGFEFQSRVATDLVRMGYLEGHVRMGPRVPEGYNHKARLKDLGHTHYESPDITVINDWMEGPKLKWKFGLCCSFRGKLWELNGDEYITIPLHQVPEYHRIVNEKKLTLYWAMGWGDPMKTEIKYLPACAPYKEIPINDHAARQKGKPFTMFAGYDWNKAMDRQTFIAERRLRGDDEVRFSISR
jgi:hypothetical protein